MQRYKITLEYEGSKYSGWQKQKNSTSIQEIVEKSISALYGIPITIYGAGRTDAKVHASGQVAHFDAPSKYQSEDIKNAINARIINNNICILSCEEVNNKFHARYSAQKRQYIYRIFNRKIRSPFHRHLYTWIKEPLNIENMQQASNYLIGTQDFASFRSSGCYSRSSIRTIESITIMQSELIEISFIAESFLYHMVRNITGTLINIGKGIILPHRIKYILHQKNRKFAPAIAPAEGLYLTKIYY